MPSSSGSRKGKEEIVHLQRLKKYHTLPTDYETGHLNRIMEENAMYTSSSTKKDRHRHQREQRHRQRQCKPADYHRYQKPINEDDEEND